MSLLLAALFYHRTIMQIHTTTLVLLLPALLSLTTLAVPAVPHGKRKLRTFVPTLAVPS